MVRNKFFIRIKCLEKKTEKNNVAIALDVFYAKKEKIYPAYVLKHYSNLKKQVVLLMIPNEEKWYHLAVKKPSALLRGIISKHHSNFYCLNYLHSFATEKILNRIKKYVKIKIFVM